MPKKLSLSEKFALGIILTAVIPYFLAIVLAVFIYKNELDYMKANPDITVRDEYRISEERSRFIFIDLLGLWLLASLSGGAVVLLLYKKVLNPIGDLSKMATAVAANKTVAIPYLKGDNEVTRLYNAVRTMGDSLMTNIRDLEKSNKTKSEFISIASHQLRTPLSAIKWLIELLKEQNLTEEQKSKMEDVYRSNERLIILVNDLLNVSRLESGGVKINPQLTNLVQFVKDLISGLSPFVEQRNQKINLAADSDAVNVMADPLLFNEAVNNILENAAAYSPPNSVIQVRVTREGNNGVISVHNDGPAIPEMDHEKLFTKFYRGVTAQRMRPTGSGLGLFITKAAVEAHRGRVWFESPTNPDDSGTTFYISLPIS